MAPHSSTNNPANAAISAGSAARDQRYFTSDHEIAYSQRKSAFEGSHSAGSLSALDWFEAEETAWSA